MVDDSTKALIAITEIVKRRASELHPKIFSFMAALFLGVAKVELMEDKVWQIITVLVSPC